MRCPEGTCAATSARAGPDVRVEVAILACTIATGRSVGRGRVREACTAIVRVLVSFEPGARVRPVDAVVIDRALIGEARSRLPGTPIMAAALRERIRGHVAVVELEHRAQRPRFGGDGTLEGGARVRALASGALIGAASLDRHGAIAAA